jgi:hypothetical protein
VSNPTLWFISLRFVRLTHFSGNPEYLNNWPFQSPHHRIRNFETTETTLHHWAPLHSTSTVFRYPSGWSSIIMLSRRLGLGRSRSHGDTTELYRCVLSWRYYFIYLCWNPGMVYLILYGLPVTDSATRNINNTFLRSQNIVFKERGCVIVTFIWCTAIGYFAVNVVTHTEEKTAGARVWDTIIKTISSQIDGKRKELDKERSPVWLLSLRFAVHSSTKLQSCDPTILKCPSTLASHNNLNHFNHCPCWADGDDGSLGLGQRVA